MTVTGTSREIVPVPSLRRKIEDLSGQTISACFQCEKCTGGCPVAFAMDIPPHRLMRLLHYGRLEEVLRSDTIWVCASCETCSTRCPNNIDISRVMDSLRQLSLEKGIKPSLRNFPVFHSAFLSSIRKHGRVHELEMAVNYSRGSAGLKGLLEQAGIGLTMFLKGKIKLLPSRIRGRRQVKDIFRKTGVKD